MKKGLILEGGAMRGLFSAGVMDVLLENNIEFDAVIGVSAGACFGCNYKSRQAGRAIRYNLKYAGDPRFCSFSSLLRTGDIYNTEFAYGTVPLKLDLFDYDAYLSNPTRFITVSTDVERGEPVYHDLTNEQDIHMTMDWIRASASMPLFANIVEIDGLKMLDGGIADSIPLRHMEEEGYDKNVVILTQPKDYIKGANKAVGLMKHKYKAYPAFVEAVKDRHNMYNAETKYVRDREEKGEAFVVRPAEPLGIAHTEKNKDKLQKVYNMGRDTMSKSLSALKEYLNIN